MGKWHDWIIPLALLGGLGYVAYKFAKGDWKIPSLELPKLELPKLELPTIPTIPLPFIATVPEDEAKTVIDNLKDLTLSQKPIGTTQEKLIDWSAWLVRQTTPPTETLLGPFGIPIAERVAPSYEPQPPPPLPPIMAAGIPAPPTTIYSGSLTEYNQLPREVKQYYLAPSEVALPIYQKYKAL